MSLDGYIADKNDSASWLNGDGRDKTYGLTMAKNPKEI